jgi:hypothetical protein
MLQAAPDLADLVARNANEKEKRDKGTALELRSGLLSNGNSRTRAEHAQQKNRNAVSEGNTGICFPDGPTLHTMFYSNKIHPAEAIPTDKIELKDQVVRR